MKKIIGLIVALSLVSCASYIALPKDTTRFAHNRIKKQEQKGLILAAEDYSESSKCRRYFYRDLLDLGYIPVYVCIGNQDDYEFSIRSENIVFRFEDGSQAQPVSFKEVIEQSQDSHALSVLLFPLGILPGILSWGSISDANDELDQDYSQKAFRDCHVVKDDHLFGFMFFKVPEGKKVTFIKDATLEIKAAKKASKKDSRDQAEIVNFVVSVDAD